MSKERQVVKINNSHGGKEFRSYFHFVGKVKPVRKKEEDSDNWVDVPFVEEGILERSGKPFRKLQFVVETALSNDLRVEIFGMEQEYAYPYSSTHRTAYKIPWKDRHDKSKYPDNTYHLILPDWDKIEEFAKIIDKDKWVEVRGYYEPQEFSTSEDGKPIRTVKRIINNVSLVEDGQEIKNGKEKIKYVCDFNNPDFKEVNYFSMQIGIKSTFQDEETGNTKVNAVYLMYGKDRSEPKDVELTVYQTEAPEGKRSLADAFATLDYLDFVEVFGVDHNRATFAYVPVEVEIENDPFEDVDDSQKQVRLERTSTGTKKGLEITGVISGSLIRGFLSEEEIMKSAEVVTDSPFENGDAFVDPFEEGATININDNDLPF